MRMSWSDHGVWYGRLLHKRRQGDVADVLCGRGRFGAGFLHRSISDISLDEHCKNVIHRWKAKYENISITMNKTYILYKVHTVDICDLAAIMNGVYYLFSNIYTNYKIPG